MKKILSLLLILSFVLTLVACGDTKSGYVADNTEHYDDITKTLHLTKEYDGKSFLTDGIGQATVNAFTDGDTVRFKLSDGEILVVRFYSVDTPESTSTIEKWGKAASIFVKQQLTGAEIVLEATESRAIKDSYGSRYLGYVWYKGEGDANFKNLNLELVENGYTDNKGVNTSDFPYFSYFKKANDFARSIQLRLYSKLADPYYSTDPVQMTLKEFYENPDAFYNEDMQLGVKVQLEAYFESLNISSSGTYNFLACQFDETGKKYSLSVYAGYSSAAASTMKVGHMYRIVGNVGKYNGAYQIASITYSPIYDKPDYTKVIQENYYCVFNAEREFIDQYSDYLYGNVTVKSINVENNIITIVGTTKQQTKDGFSSEASEFTFKVNAPENYDNNIAVGDIFATEAYQFTEGSNEFTILNYSNIYFR